MHIQSTKKVLDFFEMEAQSKNTDNDIFAWHANYEVVNRKNFLF